MDEFLRRLVCKRFFLGKSFKIWRGELCVLIKTDIYFCLFYFEKYKMKFAKVALGEVISYFRSFRFQRGSGAGKCFSLFFISKFFLFSLGFYYRRGVYVFLLVRDVGKQEKINRFNDFVYKIEDSKCGRGFVFFLLVFFAVLFFYFFKRFVRFLGRDRRGWVIWVLSLVVVRDRLQFIGFLGGWEFFRFRF